MTESDEKAFQSTSRCVLCQKTFSNNEIKVRHHLHFGMTPEKDSNMVGAAHQKCNLLAKQGNFIPVIFHNLRNFGGHIPMQSLGMFKETDIKCIPQNLERYISFSLGKPWFIDSFQFLPSSLETLVADLVSEGDRAFKTFWKEFTGEHARLLLRKGVYPYEYMDHIDRFDEISLPPIESFYSNIKGEGISTDDYKHANEVYQSFKLTNLGAYHDLYLKTDVVLLCDVFEQFRNMCLQKYELDACHFVSSPGLSWCACLKMTHIQLELLTDIDTINFFEKGTRGGISQISHRYKRANNQYLGENHYDQSSVTSFIQYLDMNNLYGLAMIQPLPTGGFRFLTDEEILKFNVLSIPKDSSFGYVCEATLEYPKELHDSHSDYCLAPERKYIENEKLSPYAQHLWKKLHGKKETDELPPRAKVEKLVTSLSDKEFYIVHYHNLQLYLQLGMRIKQMHRVLEFQQKPLLKPYIDFNTEQRKHATSSFQKNFYKLMNCSVFGKTMENVKKRVDVRLVQTEKRLQKITAKPTFKSYKIFNKDLIGIELKQAKVKLCKPNYCGMCILDLSKYAMYDFYYNYLKHKYQNKLQLLMTDTDSLLFYCETGNIYKDMEENIDFFDTSDYPEDHLLHSAKNKKELGIPIREFVGLRAKAYSFVVGSKEERKAKGVAKATVRKDLRFEMYKQTLFDETTHLASMFSIRSHLHQLHGERLNKCSLSCFDDKTYLLNATTSLAYGHYRIEK